MAILNKELKETILKLLGEGFTIRRISHITGAGRPTVMRIRKELVHQGITHYKLSSQTQYKKAYDKAMQKIANEEHEI